LATVEQLNQFVDSAAGVPEFLGADVGVDVPLSGHRSVWLFADTLVGTTWAKSFVRNSMLLFTPGCLQVVLPGRRGALVPNRDDGVGYWPMSGWVESGEDVDTVHVMLQRVAEAPGLGQGFVTMGPALAVFAMPRSGPPLLIRRVDLGPDDASPESPAWGAASVLDAGWLYLYGTSTRPLEGLHGFALRVARVRPDRVEDPTEWRYWDGRSWQADPRDATALVPELGGVSQTLSVWRQEGRWYALSKQDEFLGRRIVVWTAPAAVGPFTVAAAVADLPCDAVTGELRYMPLAHPGLLPQPGTVVVSFSRSSTDLSDICADPTRYRPHFLRVVLPE
jgi:hypothetical protein